MYFSFKSIFNRMNVAFQILLYLPINIASLMLPVNKDLWIFGAWFGERFDDNPRALYEYMILTHPDKQILWITNSNDVYEYLIEKKLPVCKKHSLRGYYACMTSNVAVVCTSFDDINKNIWMRNVVNTWHGTPLKRILHDVSDIHNLPRFKGALRRLIPRFRSLSDYFIVLSSSLKEKSILTRAFKIEPKKFIVTGHPRTDYFFSSTHKQRCKKIQVLYMPTHRSEGNSSFLEWVSDELNKKKTDLKALGVELTMKAHFYHTLPENNDSTIKVFNDDIETPLYSQIKDYDVLITDFSSIMFDWTLLDKPIIFYVPDYEEYLKNERNLYFDYEVITNGSYSLDVDNLIKELRLQLKQPLQLSNVLRDMQHYRDGESCRRAFEAINARIN